MRLGGIKLDEECPHCKRDDWKEEPVFKLLNPNGEFVEGYGCAPVMIQVDTRYRCCSCGYKLGDEVKRISHPQLLKDDERL